MFGKQLFLSVLIMHQIIIQNLMVYNWYKLPHKGIWLLLSMSKYEKGKKKTYFPLPLFPLGWTLHYFHLQATILFPSVFILDPTAFYPCSDSLVMTLYKIICIMCLLILPSENTAASWYLVSDKPRVKNGLKVQLNITEITDDLLT